MKRLFPLALFFGLVSLSLKPAAAAEPQSPVARYYPPPVAAPHKLLELRGITVAEVVIEGNDILSSAEVERIAAPYRGREVSFEQLEELRTALTRAVLEKGYINSGIVLPDQEVKDGVVRFILVRGTLTDIVIEGNHRFRSRYLESKLKLGTKPPLDVNRLQENLELLQLDPRIKSVKAELKPGERPGESVLKARIEENRPLHLALQIGNDDPPSTGSYRGDAIVSYSNLVGTGDTIEGRAGISEGNKDYSARYSIPMNARDTTFEAYFRKGETSIIEESFTDLDIESSADTAWIALVQPVNIGLTQQLKFSLAGEYRTSTTTLLGRNFSISPGDVDGKSRVSVLRLGQVYVNRGSRHLLALSSTESFGVDALGSTRHSDGQPDSRFFSWLGQLLLLRQVGPTQLVLRCDAQVADAPLLSMEKFSVGGLNSVRGYRRSLLVRDNGVSGTVESHILLFENGAGEPVFSLVPFYDAGYARESADGTGRSDFVDSVGLGFRWAPARGALVEFYYGHALREVKVSDHDPQDDGIHFNVSWQVF